ncbi:MAG: DUF1003 domain-containing protein [Patescibacteria group bacterium]|nr:DUF1003 domain-containing protein [Patescibacteria group bacterium]
MDNRSFGQRAADEVTARLGSWRFLIIQTLLLTLWVLLNTLLPGSNRWDVYPFIFLNLMLSFQAAYTGPIVMISQNRQEEIQRETLHAILVATRAIEMIITDQHTLLSNIYAHMEEDSERELEILRHVRKDPSEDTSSGHRDSP